jgi:hypothetical protein
VSTAPRLLGLAPMVRVGVGSCSLRTNLGSNRHRGARACICEEGKRFTSGTDCMPAARGHNLSGFQVISENLKAPISRRNDLRATPGSDSNPGSGASESRSVERDSASLVACAPAVAPVVPHARGRRAVFEWTFALTRKRKYRSRRSSLLRVEAEHRPALVVLSDAAMGHPPAVGDLEESVRGGGGR